jgi:hypothetical protein
MLCLFQQERVWGLMARGFAGNFGAPRKYFK